MPTGPAGKPRLVDLPATLKAVELRRWKVPEHPMPSRTDMTKLHRNERFRLSITGTSVRRVLSSPPEDCRTQSPAHVMRSADRTAKRHQPSRASRLVPFLGLHRPKNGPLAADFRALLSEDIRPRSKCGDTLRPPCFPTPTGKRSGVSAWRMFRWSHQVTDNNWFMKILLVLSTTRDEVCGPSHRQHTTCRVPAETAQRRGSFHRGGNIGLPTTSDSAPPRASTFPAEETSRDTRGKGPELRILPLACEFLA